MGDQPDTSAIRGLRPGTGYGTLVRSFSHATVGSAGANAAFRVGDQIFKVNEREVSRQEYIDLMRSALVDLLGDDDDDEVMGLGPGMTMEELRAEVARRRAGGVS